MVSLTAVSALWVVGMAAVFTLRPSIRFNFEAGVCSGAGGSARSVYIESSYQMDATLTVAPVRITVFDNTIGGLLPWEKTFEIIASRRFAVPGSEGCVPNSQAANLRRLLQAGPPLDPGEPSPADVVFASDTRAYNVSAWAPCDSACGPGNRTRTVQCILATSGVPMSAAECTAAGLGPQPAAVEACQMLPSSACFGVEPRPGPVRLAMGDHATVAVTSFDVLLWSVTSFETWTSYKLVGFTMPNNTRNSLEVKLQGNAGGNVEAWYRCTGCTDGMCEGACASAGSATAWVRVRANTTDLLCACVCVRERACERA
jgi:hypothetical protein